MSRPTALGSLPVVSKTDSASSGLDDAKVPADMSKPSVSASDGPAASAEDRGVEVRLDVTAGKSNMSDYFTVLAAGAALLSDGLQNNIMTMANVVFQKIYGKNVYTSDVSTRVSNALLVGAVLGQVTVGVITDRIGRKTALVATTLLIVIGSILSAGSYGKDVQGMFWMLTVARGIAGFGVGGEYPASSTSASEAANDKFGRNRGSVFVMCTNFVLCFGGPLAVCIFLIVLSAAGEDHLKTVWRVSFAVITLFPITVFYFRLKILNSRLYRRGAIKRNVPYWLVLKRYKWDLFGTCGAWFLYDFVTFPNGIFSGTIISSIVKDASVKKTAEWQLLLGTIALPGVFVGAWLCGVIGRRNTLIIGFSGYLIIGLIIGCAYDKIVAAIPAFVILYGLMQSMGNLGPGDMLGLVSSESYPTALRGTCYGISAAIGKVGAAVGTQAFTPIQNNLGKRWTFIIAALCGVLGMAIAFFFIKDKSAEDLASEDEAFRRYLVENGWNGQLGDGTEGLHKVDEVCIEDIDAEAARMPR